MGESDNKAIMKWLLTIAPKMTHWLKYSCLIVFSCSLIPNSVLAQIASDGTLAVPTVVNTDNNLDFQIINGTQAGSNLYHSFQELSVPTGGSAVFQNNANIINIFSRITGQNISNIDGLLQTSGSASLFLLNPNGIIFGNNASLDIGGSFIATTAESIVFQDGKLFSSVINQSSPLLSINLPVGLQFGRQAQPIQVQTFADQLVLQPNNTLALLGGDISIIGSPLPDFISGHLKAPEGRIELGSVEAQSFVDLMPTAVGWQFSYPSVQQFRDITLSQLARVDVSEGTTETGAGSIQVTGKNITLIEGGELVSLTVGEKSGGDISVNASETLTLRGFQDGLSSAIFTITIGDGNAGNIQVNTKNLVIENGAGIASQAFENASGFSILGSSGNIEINATESIEIRGSNLEVGNSQITVRTRTAGNAGNIDITTKRLTIQDGAEITASTVPPPDAREQGLVNEGQGGSINITATEFIDIRGTGLLREFNINTGANEITIIPSRIIAETQGAGDGGNINITTGQLILDDQGQINANSVGEIGADNDQNLQLGDAGTININANAIFINNQGLISAESNSGEGGNINLQASDFILLRNNNSNLPDENPFISTRAGIDGESGGNGGNLTIDTPFLAAVSTENTDIVANAFTGNGGNIEITAFGIFGLEIRDDFTSLSDINASSEFGSSGVINVSRPDIDPQDSFVKLPADIVDPQTLVVQQCGVTGEYAKGEFIIIGKSGLPVNPLESVDTIQGIVDLRTPEISQSEHNFPNSVTLSPFPKPIIEAQGWVKDEAGNIVLVASQGTTSWQNDIPCTVESSASLSNDG